MECALNQLDKSGERNRGLKLKAALCSARDNEGRVRMSSMLMIFSLKSGDEPVQ